MIKLFIQLLLEKINEYYTCFYEEAPNTAQFPYLVVPTITLTPLNAGYTCLFDIEVYNNELSTIRVEDILDNLKYNLDNYSYCDEEIGFHLGFESTNILKSSEQDLLIRKITFSARIFRKEI